MISGQVWWAFWTSPFSVCLKNPGFCGEAVEWMRRQLWSQVENLHSFTAWTPYKYSAFTATVRVSIIISQSLCEMQSLRSHPKLAHKPLFSKVSSSKMTDLETNWLYIVVNFLKAMTYLENATQERRVYWITVMEYSQSILEGNQGSRSPRHQIILHGQSGSRERWMLVLRPTSSFLLSLETQLLE